MTVSIDRELLDRVRALARREERSVSQIARRILRAALESPSDEPARRAQRAATQRPPP